MLLNRYCFPSCDNPAGGTMLPPHGRLADHLTWPACYKGKFYFRISQSFLEKQASLWSSRSDQFSWSPGEFNGAAGGRPVSYSSCVQLFAQLSCICWQLHQLFLAVWSLFSDCFCKLSGVVSSCFYSAAVTETASEILGKHCQKKKPWITAEILDLCVKRRELRKKRFEPEGSEKYKEVNNIKRCLKKAKENWIGEQSSETEENPRKNNSKRAYHLVKDLTTVKQGKASTVQDHSGKYLTEEQQILNSWTKYCSELYNYKADGDPSVLNCPQTHRMTTPLLQRSGGCSTISEERELSWSQQHPSRTSPSRWKGSNHRSHGNLQQDLADRRMANPMDPVHNHHTSQEGQPATVPELPNNKPHQSPKHEATSEEDHCRRTGMLQSRKEYHRADLQPKHSLWEIPPAPARPLPCLHRLKEGLWQCLACSFVGNHEEVHQHKPYPSHQKPLQQGH